MARTVVDILEELETTSGKNARLEILEAARNNAVLKQLFFAAQDPYTVYYVSKFKMPAVTSKPKPDDEVILSFLVGIDALLASRKLTGNAAKDWVNKQFSTMTELQQKWCLRTLLKNLRVGLQESSINKVWPGIVKSFSVALAVTLKSDFVKGEGIKILGKVTYPVRVEPKLDGLRLIAVKQNGVVTFYTRNGTVLESMPKIRATLTNAKYDNIVLDGEGMAADWNESSSVMMSGRCSKSKSGAKEQKDDSNIYYNVFDALPLDHWTHQESAMTYKSRLEIVATVVAACGEPIRQVPHINAQNEEELKAYFAKSMDEGFEGVMLKTLHTPYEWDRSKNLQKLKPVVTYEGVIVGHYEGHRGSKREGYWGGFQVVLPNGVVTRLGGGFNDAFRAQVALGGPDTYIGKIVELEAQPDPLTADGLSRDGKARFPVYIRFRDPSDVDPKVMQAYRAHAKP